MEQPRNVRSGWLLAQSAERVQTLLWQARCLRLLTWLMCGAVIAVAAWLIVGCATPRAADPPPPCPLPSDAAVEAMGRADPALAGYLGRVLRYCEGIDELRK